MQPQLNRQASFRPQLPVSTTPLPLLLKWQEFSSLQGTSDAALGPEVVFQAPVQPYNFCCNEAVRPACFQACREPFHSLAHLYRLWRKAEELADRQNIILWRVPGSRQDWKPVCGPARPVLLKDVTQVLPSSHPNHSRTTCDQKEVLLPAKSQVVVSGLSLPSFVSKVSLELCLTEPGQLPDVFHSQDVCDGSAKLASQVTATAEKERKIENTNEVSHGDYATSLCSSSP